MMVKMVSPFLKQKMRERIHIVEEGELEGWIEKDQLTVELGGTFQYNHEDFIQKQMHLAELGISHLSVHTLNTNTPLPDTIPNDNENEQHQFSLDNPLEVQKARQSIINDLDARIREHEENMKNKTLPADIVRILQTRAMRISVDYGEIPSMEPNIVHYGLEPIEEVPQVNEVELTEEKVSDAPVKRRAKRDCDDDRRKMRTAFFGGEGDSAFYSQNIAQNASTRTEM